MKKKIYIYHSYSLHFFVGVRIMMTASPPEKKKKGSKIPWVSKFEALAVYTQYTIAHRFHLIIVYPLFSTKLYPMFSAICWQNLNALNRFWYFLIGNTSTHMKSWSRSSFSAAIFKQLGFSTSVQTQAGAHRWRASMSAGYDSRKWPSSMMVWLPLLNSARLP